MGSIIDEEYRNGRVAELEALLDGIFETLAIGHDGTTTRQMLRGIIATVLEAKDAEIEKLTNAADDALDSVAAAGKEIERMKSHQFAAGVDGPEVTGQMLSDCGLNPFAFTLLAESFEKHTAEPKPFTVRHKGHIFHMRPIEDEEADDAGS